jgi:hypothetical protein
MVHSIYKGKSRVLMGIDDTPTKRYGPHVCQGARKIGQ